MKFRCSFSQVHSYGTVDFEKRERLKWSSLYRKIAMMEDPGIGASSVIEKWELEERKISKWDLCRVVKELRKFRRFKLALDVSKGSFANNFSVKLHIDDCYILLNFFPQLDII